MRRKSALLVVLALVSGACREWDGQRTTHAELRPPQAGPTPSVSHSEARTDALELVARHPSGVPLHPAVGSSDVNARLPGGTRVVVEEQSPDGRWLRIRANDGTVGWITRRYTRETNAPKAPLAVPGHDSPWSSPERCQALLEAKDYGSRSADTVRLATWNLRWFPDGRPGQGRADAGGTDIAWLACAIAWLELDVVAVQEMKAHARARERTQELLALLDQRTQGRWQLRVDDCPNAAGQHVGLLWNEKRAIASAWTTLPSLNPHGEPCKDQLRPGLAARFRFGGGLDLMVVSVHLKSGGERRSFELRRRSLAGLSSSLSELLTAAGGDGDVLIAGDLNTMGCPGCSPPISSDEELAVLDKEVAAQGLRVVPASLRCSEYFEGSGALLDHFVAATSMAELPAERRSSVSGFCGEARCEALPRRAMPRAHAALSDHCPVILEMNARGVD